MILSPFKFLNATCHLEICTVNRASLEEKMALTGNVKTRAVVKFYETDKKHRPHNHLKWSGVQVLSCSTVVQ